MARLSNFKIEPVSRDFVERIANIIGPNSAAAKALAELDMRLANGEDVAVFQAADSWFVGPAPEDKVTITE